MISLSIFYEILYVAKLIEFDETCREKVPGKLNLSLISLPYKR